MVKESTERGKGRDEKEEEENEKENLAYLSPYEFWKLLSFPKEGRRWLGSSQVFLFPPFLLVSGYFMYS